ncbi:hypothetical protein CP967_07840 [Streptomyces nitrosporeus]|uniref:Uncharacterized protein n=1 Tax=Streptomyces nitrosporeus TaxID=28894 RepID=A0A5J6F6C0_9ACTN|nr:hypothetical protein [Streptomyces nitrosporeus]QEU71888.1 hypothetical protein CP967_07840 [Streptomyces nitrosporeus]
MVRRWVPASVLGGVWCWAVLRLLLEPEHAGLVEGAVAAGGWGLSLLPVHVAPPEGPAGGAECAAGERPGAGKAPGDRGPSAESSGGP